MPIQRSTTKQPFWGTLPRGLAGGLVCGLALGIALVAATPVLAQQAPAAPGQPASGWGGVDVKPQPPPSWAPSQTNPAPPRAAPNERSQPNTTVVPRSAGEQRPAAQLTLTALLTEDGQPIDQGLVWRVFRDKAGPEKGKLLATHREAVPVLRLEPGDYVINAAFGRSHLTRKVSVVAGRQQTEKFVLNAGGLRILATLSGVGEAGPERVVLYDIYSDERDQYGQRTRIMSGAKPGLIIRLNAGLYQIVSTYGDANSIVRSDVTVEPGKLTDATIVHTGAPVTFKLVAQTGGDAMADTTWSIFTPQGDMVKETAGAVPSHILAAGTYSVSARHAGRVFRRDFNVQAGEATQVEVMMR
jgi:hypothetical protein